MSVYFFSHYMFASLTAHTTALLPVLLAVGAGIRGMPADKLALALALTTGIMGVLTPYATGPGLAYYGAVICRLRTSGGSGRSSDSSFSGRCCCSACRF